MGRKRSQRKLERLVLQRRKEIKEKVKLIKRRLKTKKNMTRKRSQRKLKRLVLQRRKEIKEKVKLIKRRLKMKKKMTIKRRKRMSRFKRVIVFVIFIREEQCFCVSLWYISYSLAFIAYLFSLGL